MDWSYDSASSKFEVTETQDLISTSGTGIGNVLFDVDAVKECRVLIKD